MGIYVKSYLNVEVFWLIVDTSVKEFVVFYEILAFIEDTIELGKDCLVVSKSTLAS